MNRRGNEDQRRTSGTKTPHRRATSPNRVGVFGLGNLLRRDDGFGPSVVRRLEERYEFDDDVVVRDLGTPGRELASHLCGLDAVILVDTIDAPGEPGALQVLDGRTLRSTRDALQRARRAGGAPDTVRLVAAIPADRAMGPGLSSAIAAACDEACDLVVDELERLGHGPAPRGAHPHGRGGRRAHRS